MANAADLVRAQVDLSIAREEVEERRQRACEYERLQDTPGPLGDELRDAYAWALARLKEAEEAASAAESALAAMTPC